VAPIFSLSKNARWGKLTQPYLALTPGYMKDPNAGKITVLMKNNTLYLQAPPLGPEPQELYPESSTDFFILSDDVTFSFQRDEKGNVSKLVVHAFGHNFEVKKTS
jgi:uncharacterized protein DUF3471